MCRRGDARTVVVSSLGVPTRLVVVLVLLPRCLVNRVSIDRLSGTVSAVPSQGDHHPRRDPTTPTTNSEPLYGGDSACVRGSQHSSSMWHSGPGAFASRASVVSNAVASVSSVKAM